jgi:hypothetical protein
MFVFILLRFFFCSIYSAHFTTITYLGATSTKAALYTKLIIKETIISTRRSKMTSPLKITQDTKRRSSVTSLHKYTSISSTESTLTPQTGVTSQTEVTSEDTSGSLYTDNYGVESTLDSQKSIISTSKEQFQATSNRLVNGIKISTLSENSLHSTAFVVYNGETTANPSNKIDLTTIIVRETVKLLTTLKSMDNVLYTTGVYSQKEVSTNTKKLLTSTRKLTVAAMIKG